MTCGHLEKEGDVGRLACHLQWTRDSVLLGEGLGKDGFEQILSLQSPGLLCSTLCGFVFECCRCLPVLGVFILRSFIFYIKSFRTDFCCDFQRSVLQIHILAIA